MQISFCEKKASSAVGSLPDKRIAAFPHFFTIAQEAVQPLNPLAGFEY